MKATKHRFVLSYIDNDKNTGKRANLRAQGVIKTRQGDWALVGMSQSAMNRVGRHTSAWEVETPNGPQAVTMLTVENAEVLL